MSDRRYYFADKQRYNPSADNDCVDEEPLYPCNDVDGNEEGANAEANVSAYLQDVPYSSSSVDRSSIGSIPWADDAIKKNKLDWERVERMLSGEEPLTEQEPELRHEIADWQQKFPSLLGRKAQPMNQLSFDSINDMMLPDDIDSMSNLSLNSLDDDVDDDDDEGDDGFLTPTAERLANRQPQQQQQHFVKRPTKQLVELLDKDLRITSVKLRKRENAAQPPPPANAHSASTAPRSRLRMPPILNVLDSNRRFRGLLNNRSFVQLTQVQQQAKSAALNHHGHATSAERQSNRSAWHMPAVAAATFSSRFLNNKHAIVLPSLTNRHHRHGHATTNMGTIAATSSQSNSSGGGGAHSNSSSSGLGSGMGIRRNVVYKQQQQQHHHHHHQQFSSVPLPSNTPSTGRSISAAVHHPRSEFTANAFYIPYSASKFKAFK